MSTKGAPHFGFELLPRERVIILRKRLKALHGTGRTQEFNATQRALVCAIEDMKRAQG